MGSCSMNEENYFSHKYGIAFNLSIRVIKNSIASKTVFIRLKAQQSSKVNRNG